MTKVELTFEILKTIAVAAIPILVATLGYRLNRRLKLWEASQWRNQELIKARFEYYQLIAPLLNDLMCYLTFIGTWKEHSPPDVVAIKRDVDRHFSVALPIFSHDCSKAYEDFMSACFQTFGKWGEDAKLRTGFVRRQEAFSGVWRQEWNDMFTHAKDQPVLPEEQERVRHTYDKVLGVLAKDIQLLEPRERYATEIAYSQSAR
jgi:hypothetical protein